MTFCAEPDCNISACYNYIKESKGMFCKAHMKLGMCDVRHPKCKYAKCSKIAHYNYINEKRGIFCSDHQEENMQNVIAKLCNYEGCLIRPTFNYPGEMKALFCKQHMKKDMCDLISRKCKSCSKYPSFNYVGEARGVFCSQHKLADMIDVKHKKCIYKDCSKRPHFNYQGEIQARFCQTHKLHKMIDINHPRCNSCDLFRVSKKGNRCDYCNPDSKLKKRTKESQIKALLQKHDILSIHNKSVSNDCCLKYRPDFVIDCQSYFVILEVDEFAHSSYDKDCEIVRMNNISHSLGLPTKFLRYNPDNKNFTTDIKEQTLIKRLKELLNNTNDDFQVEYLFYP